MPDAHAPQIFQQRVEIMGLEDEPIGALPTLFTKRAGLRLTDVWVPELDEGAVAGVEDGALPVGRLRAVHDLHTQIAVVEAGT